jgi:hypothetical protein
MTCTRQEAQCKTGCRFAAPDRDTHGEGVQAPGVRILAIRLGISVSVLVFRSDTDVLSAKESWE